jgi:hypothetical protein
VDTFLENAQRIFDVARADNGAEYSDFALLVRPDGSLHIVMESAMNLDAVAAENGARTAYRVCRSRDGVRVSGQNATSRCELSSQLNSTRRLNGTKGFDSAASATAARSDLLRDQPLYLIASPALLA